MVICKVSCPAYNSCKERELNQRCTYDLGIFNSKEDMDDEDPIERFMY
jgi:hypothetical protein